MPSAVSRRSGGRCWPQSIPSALSATTAKRHGGGQELPEGARGCSDHLAAQPAATVYAARQIDMARPRRGHTVLVGIDMTRSRFGGPSRYPRRASATAQVSFLEGWRTLGEPAPGRPVSIWLVSNCVAGGTSCNATSWPSAGRGAALLEARRRSSTFRPMSTADRRYPEALASVTAVL